MSHLVAIWIVVIEPGAFSNDVVPRISYNAASLPLVSSVGLVCCVI
jgi:hypothetical protein